jgi:hypothetical protein
MKENETQKSKRRGMLTIGSVFLTVDEKSEEKNLASGAGISSGLYWRASGTELEHHFLHSPSRLNHKGRNKKGPQIRKRNFKPSF